MPNKENRPTVTRELAKRRAHLDHAREDLDAFCDRVKRYRDYAPDELVAECADARDKLDHAYETLAAYDESAATSAISTLTRDSMEAGAMSILAGHKTAGQKKVEREPLEEIVRDWHRRNPIQSRGWKTALADYLVEKTRLSNSPYTFNGARKFLLKHKYFLD